jgi:hypothetical protein
MPAIACSATQATGAVATAACLYSGTGGAGGYTYYYNDGTSTACVDSAALCTQGSVGVSSSTIWGAGFGFSVANSDGSAVTLSATGLTFAAAGTSLPTGLQIGLVSSTGPCATTNGCCYRPTAVAGATIPWKDFVPSCYSGATDAGSFAPSDGLTKLEFQVVAGTAAQTYNYCITSLSF